jgi:hypothetical protein
LIISPDAGACFNYSHLVFVPQVSLFTLHILSVPGIMEHLNNICPEVLNSLLLQKETHVLAKSVRFLSQDQQLKVHFDALEGSYALCLTANLIHLVRRKEKRSIHRSSLGQGFQIFWYNIPNLGGYTK